MDLERLEKLHGRVKEITIPSGAIVVIREQNGEDDDILSTPSGLSDGSSVANFIAAIVVSHSDYPNVVVTGAMVKKWKLRDKYYILTASRVFSLGAEIRFDFKWPDIKKPVEYLEDLSQYVPDLSKPLPTEKDEDYFEGRIEPYENSKEQERILQLSSGKSVKYQYATGESEAYMMKVEDSSMSRNQELFARNLSLYLPSENSEEGTWVKVETFKSFSSKDMREIRSDIERFDPEVNIVSEIVHPNKPDVVTYYPLMSNSSFFFPVEI